MIIAGSTRRFTVGNWQVVAAISVKWFSVSSLRSKFGGNSLFSLNKIFANNELFYSFKTFISVDYL